MVRLMRLAPVRLDEAPLTAQNRTKTVYPQTVLRLVFELAGGWNRQTHSAGRFPRAEPSRAPSTLRTRPTSPVAAELRGVSAQGGNGENQAARVPAARRNRLAIYEPFYAELARRTTSTKPSVD